MGNNSNRPERSIPEKGYRVNNITKRALAEKLDVLTDYILSPDPKQIDLRKETIKFEIYSILTASIRTVELPIVNRQLGLQLRLQQISDCVLRVTKIFNGSPLEKHNVQPNEFIVGVIEGQFTCIKSFAELVRKLTLINPKGSISLGICCSEGKTRVVPIPVLQLKQWSTKGRGLLGCELAEGWIHRWKPFKSKEEDKVEKKAQEKKMGEIPQMKDKQTEGEVHSGSSEEIDQKCDGIDGRYDENGIMEVKFKGFLKNEQMVDASSICRCRPMEKECEKCFVEKEANYYFFNKKTNQIMTIPTSMMLKVHE